VRIVHLSTWDTKGGAARSAHRLHRALLEAGVDSAMLARSRLSNEETIHEIRVAPDADRRETPWKLIQRECVDTNRTELSNTKFSLARPGFNVSAHPLIETADVVHLHWVCGFLSPAGVAALGATGRPMVWTLHDQRPLTGGCHFSAGCTGFVSGCKQCPQLRAAVPGLTSAGVADMRDAVPSRLVVVAPSRWLANCARESAVLDGRRTEVIPYGIDTAVFRPHEQTAARREFGLRDDATCIVFGADNSGERRKGFEVMADAVAAAMAGAEFRRAVGDGRVQLLVFGDCPADSLARLQAPVRALGRINSDVRLAKLFSACDLLLLPSLEDNLPNVLLEAMCCGVAPIAHAVGGIPDAVVDGVNGALVRAGDVRGFATALVAAVKSPATVAGWREECRREAPRKFSLAATAGAYRALYESMSAERNAVKAGRTAPVCPATGSGPLMDKLFPSLVTEARSRRKKRLLGKFTGGLLGTRP
jgi:glycosyltransferase involved in cell wall biosynthesis